MNSIPQTNQRLLAFDAIKIFAILLVIWGHCIGQLSSCDVANRSVYRIIYSFHMPLFMMISGYFANSSMNIPPISFIKKKFRQLIYPCIAMGLIIWICIETAHSFHYKREDISLCALMTDFYWFSDFWFLKSCFVCYVLAYLGIRSRLKPNYWIVITLILSQFIAPFFVSFMYPCFVLGMALRKYGTLKQRIFKYKWLIISIFTIMLLFYSSEAWNKSHGIPQGIFQADYLFWMKIIYYRMYRLFVGVLGALSVYVIFTLFFKKTHQHSLIEILANQGKYTLEVYILQAIILEKIIAHYLKFDYMSGFIYNFIVTPMIASFLLIIFILITKTIYKIPKLGFILFGKTI